MNIFKQKTIARNILNRLRVFDPGCVLAGGAPRDWYFNNLATDLDFYISVKGMHEETIRELIDDLLTFEKENPTSCYASSQERVYIDSLSGIYTVLNFEIEKTQVQVVLTLQTIEDTIESFPFNVCQAWWTGNKIHTTEFFNSGVERKELIRTPTTVCNQRYKNKILLKFSHFTVLSEPATLPPIVNWFTSF